MNTMCCISYRGREDFVPQLDLVLEKDGDIIGHIMYVRGKIQADDGSEIPVYGFLSRSASIPTGSGEALGKRWWTFRWKRPEKWERKSFA